MNYRHIESLVKKAKEKDKDAKEELIREFKPMILNIAKRTFIDGYEFYDIKNECYMTLLKCVNMYDIDNHRFVAYATNAIKNNIRHMIRKSKKRSSAEGIEALILTDNLEHTLLCDMEPIEDIVISNTNLNNLLQKVNSLSDEEKEIIQVVYVNKTSVSKYARRNNISYPTALYKRNMLLKKMKTML